VSVPTALSPCLSYSSRLSLLSRLSEPASLALVLPSGFDASAGIVTPMSFVVTGGPWALRNSFAPATLRTDPFRRWRDRHVVGMVAEPEPLPL
jgi:hypothetical protein